MKIAFIILTVLSCPVGITVMVLFLLTMLFFVDKDGMAHRKNRQHLGTTIFESVRYELRCLKELITP